MIQEIVLQGRKVVGGHAEGYALVSKDCISFMGSTNPKTGYIIEKGHELEGLCMQGKILCFPSSKGSTGGSYMLYDEVKRGVGPAGIINVAIESIVAIGAIVSELPLIDGIDITRIRTGDYVIMDGDKGIATIRREV